MTQRGRGRGRPKGSYGPTRARCLVLFDRGLSTSAIAKAIGRTRQNVSLMLHRAGRDPDAQETQRLAAKREHFCKVWRASSTLANVAKMLGLSVAHVRSRAAKLRARGVKLKELSGLRDRAARKLANQQRFVATWNAAPTVEKAARLLGWGVGVTTTIASRLRQLGLAVEYRRKPPPPHKRAHRHRANGTSNRAPEAPALSPQRAPS